MKNAFPILAALFLLVSASDILAQNGKPSPSLKEKNIRQLLKLTGSGNLGRQTLEQLLGPMREALPQVPEEFWQDFMVKAKPERMVDLVVPIYMEHFTDEEIDAMLVFYKSEAGQSVIRKLPIVTQESILAGQQWGQEIGFEIIEELKAKGYNLDR